MNRTHVRIGIEREPESLVVIEGLIHEGTARVVRQGGSGKAAEQGDAVSNYSIATRNQAAVILSVSDTVGSYNIAARVLATEGREWRQPGNTGKRLVCRWGAALRRVDSHDGGGSACVTFAYEVGRESHGQGYGARSPPYGCSADVIVFLLGRVRTP